MPNETTEKHDTLIGCGCFIILIIVLLICVTTIFKSFDKQNSKEIATTKSQNYISENTFNGEWALTVPEVDIFCVDLGGMTGSKVKIDNMEYAITQNITDIAFLPSSYWKNMPEDENGICNGVVIGNECKVSLYDMTKYADTLCK